MYAKMFCFFLLVGVASARHGMKHHMLEERKSECEGDTTCEEAVDKCYRPEKNDDFNREDHKDHKAELLNSTIECLEENDVKTDDLTNLLEMLQNGRQGGGGRKLGGGRPGGFLGGSRRDGGLKRKIKDAMNETLQGLDEETRKAVQCCIGEKMEFTNSDGEIDAEAVKMKLAEKYAGEGLTALQEAADKCAAEITDCDYMKFKKCIKEECITAIIAG